VSLFGGGEYGRWFAIVVGALAALGALLSIPVYPLWSIAIFALSLWIIDGLVIYGEPEPTEVSGPSQGAPPPTAAAGPSPPGVAARPQEQKPPVFGRGCVGDPARTWRLACALRARPGSPSACAPGAGPLVDCSLT